MDEQMKRQVAYKSKIIDLLEGEFVKKEGWEPSFIRLADRTISRVNILGVIISKEDNESYSNIVLDDGTAQIAVRDFDGRKIFEPLAVGDICMIIGKIREYSKERFVMPEIVKKVTDGSWLEVRKAEMKGISSSPKNELPQAKEEKALSTEKSTSNLGVSAQEKAVAIIRRLDKGKGADQEDVLKALGSEKGEEVISKLLMEGEIFEISPGRFKVLE